jgi:hypothetical protein
MEEKRKIIVLIDHSVYKFTELKKLVVIDPDMRIFSCLTEEEVFFTLKNNAVDLIIMNPILPVSFLKMRRSKITNPEKGGVGHMLIRGIQKTTERASKQPLIVYNSHLSAEKLVEYGFQDVYGNHLPQKDSLFHLVKIMEEKLQLVD